MKALTWHGRHDVRIDTVDDPGIVNPRDCIIKVTSTAICGSDLHLYDGYIPTMQAGDVLVIHYARKTLTVRIREVPLRGLPSLKPAELYEILSEAREDPLDWLASSDPLGSSAAPGSSDPIGAGGAER